MKSIRKISIVHGFGMQLMSSDEKDKYSYLLISGFGFALMICLGKLLAPGKEWVDLSHNIRANSLGYWTPCKRVYGFHYCRGYARIFYGLQKSFSEKSQFKNLRMPWNEWRYVRRSLYGVNGECYYTLEAPNLDTPEIRDAEDRLLNIFIAFCPKARFRFYSPGKTEAVATTYVEEREWRLGVGWMAWLSWFAPARIRRTLQIFSVTDPKFKGNQVITIQQGEPHEAAFRRACAIYDCEYIERLPDLPEDETCI